MCKRLQQPGLRPVEGYACEQTPCRGKSEQGDSATCVAPCSLLPQCRNAPLIAGYRTTCTAGCKWPALNVNAPLSGCLRFSQGAAVTTHRCR